MIIDLDIFFVLFEHYGTFTRLCTFNSSNLVRSIYRRCDNIFIYDKGPVVSLKLRNNPEKYLFKQPNYWYFSTLQNVTRSCNTTLP